MLFLGLVQLSQIYFPNWEAPKYKTNLDVNQQIQTHLQSVKPRHFQWCSLLLTWLKYSLTITLTADSNKSLNLGFPFDKLEKASYVGCVMTCGLWSNSIYSQSTHSMSNFLLMISWYGLVFILIPPEKSKLLYIWINRQHHYLNFLGWCGFHNRFFILLLQSLSGNLWKVLSSDEHNWIRHKKKAASLSHSQWGSSGGLDREINHFIKNLSSFHFLKPCSGDCPISTFQYFTVLTLPWLDLLLCTVKKIICTPTHFHSSSLIQL